MKRKGVICIITALCLIFTAAFSSCSKPQTEETAPAEAPTRKVIIDTDTGADDASAIILAAKSGKLDILGVTTLVGNVDLKQSTRNALAALEIAGCSAPVYNGSSENYKGKKIEAYSVFGTDGMGDAGIVKTKSMAQDVSTIMRFFLCNFVVNMSAFGWKMLFYTIFV